MTATQTSGAAGELSTITGTVQEVLDLFEERPEHKRVSFEIFKIKGVVGPPDTRDDIKARAVVKL